MLSACRLVRNNADTKSVFGLKPDDLHPAVKYELRGAVNACKMLGGSLIWCGALISIASSNYSQRSGADSL